MRVAVRVLHSCAFIVCVGIHAKGCGMVSELSQFYILDKCTANNNNHRTLL